ncbi:MAG: hypothetical protein R3C24_17520 [Cyanobacteriota/Melainabacteria group bacterium]|nr:hypothetical protein [Cyanobacteria bacterium HKST-UBA01]
MKTDKITRESPKDVLRAMQPNSVVLYDATSFGCTGSEETLLLSEKTPWQIHSLADLRLRNKVASIRWNINEGSIFKLFEHQDGSGWQLSFSGAGQMPRLESDGESHEIAGWGWFTSDQFIKKKTE